MENHSTVHESTNRGNNLLVIGLLVFTGLGVAGEIFREAELRDKGDDIFIVLLAIAGIIWYFSGRNRYRISWFPFILLAVTALTKVGTVFQELTDPTAIGDEFGLVLPLVLMTIITGIMVARAHRDQRLPEAPPASEMMHSGD